MRTELYPITGPWPGRLAIMPRPRGGDWLEDEIQAWRRADVDVVVSLLTPEEQTELDVADEQRLCRAAGVEYVSFPVIDRGVPLSVEDFANLVQQLGELLTGGKSVAVHCRQGVGRAALVAICLLVWAGIDPSAATHRVSVARGCPVPETPEQHRWIAEFAEELSAGLPG